ncbi:MAG: TIR domain-containing protein, partial [Chloroflexi bacterium]|nr:TIR domain-containing protein [Chloroflexota bacterium]
MTENSENGSSTKVFISYSRKDKAFVQTLHDQLVAQRLNTWVDWEGIPLSADWWAEIKEGIEGSEAFLFVISPDSLASEICGDEIQEAVDNNKRLIPILYRDPSKDTPMHPKISSHNWIFMRDQEELNKNIGDLITTVNTDLEWVKAHTRLLQRAVEWQQQSLNSSFLLRGDDLKSAEAWLKLATEDKEPQPTDLQTDYIKASHRDATRRRRLTIAGILIGLIIAVLAVIAVLSSIEANEQRKIANEQRELAQKNADRAAFSATELLIQPAIFEYSIEGAMTRATNELKGYEANVSPEAVVATTLLNAALTPEFMSEYNPPDPQKTTAMLTIVTNALDTRPDLVEERQSDLGILYSKICQQIPYVSSHKTLLPACTEAIRLADSIENPWLSFQVCSLQRFSKLEDLTADIQGICQEFDTLAHDIEIEESVSEILDAGQNQVWQFEGEEGATLYILMKADNSDLDSFLDLYSIDGTLLYSDDQGGGANDALVVYTLDETAKYTLVARGFDTKTNGAYILEISTEPISIYDNFSRGELSLGNSVEDSVSLDDPIHNWTFTGEADQTIAIYMGTTDGNLDSYLTVLGPDGSFIAEDDNNGGGLDSLIFMTLPDSGQYLIEARAWDPETNEGSYVLEVTEDVGNFIEGNILGELTPGVPVSSFRAVGVTDQWTFSGEAGDTVSIAMVADESDLDGYLVLLGPGGNIIMEDDDSYGDLNPLIVAELPLTGMYTVLADGFDTETSGAYKLELGDRSLDFTVGKPPNFAEETTEFLTDVAVVMEPTTLFATPDVSSTQLGDVAAGELVEAYGRSDNNSWLYVLYIDNQGELIEGFAAANRLDYPGDVEALPEIDPFETVAPEIEDEDQPTTTAPVPSTDEAIVTQSAAIFTEPSNSSTQLDAAQVDDIMTVNGRSANNSWLHVTFEDGNGNLIDGFVSVSRIDYAGNITALPIIEKSDDSSSPGDTTSITGTIPLTSTVEPDDGASALLVSDIYQSFIGYDSANTSNLGQNERHIWEFDGNAGDIIDISMVSTDGSLDSYLILFAPDGRHLTDDDDSFGDSDAYIGAYTLPDTGTYSIIAQGFDEFTSGPYELNLFLTSSGSGSGSGDDDGTSSISLSPSDIYQGFIFPGSPVVVDLGQNESHTWEFDGSAGDTVDISMISTDGNLDSYLTLLAPDGRHLIDDDDGYGGSDAYIGAFSLPDTGTYTVIAKGFDEFTSGPYELNLSQTSSGNGSGSNDDDDDTS